MLVLYWIFGSVIIFLLNFNTLYIYLVDLVSVLIVINIEGMNS